jgi:hypothetical protein
VQALAGNHSKCFVATRGVQKGGEAGEGEEGEDDRKEVKRDMIAMRIEKL